METNKKKAKKIYARALLRYAIRENQGIIDGKNLALIDALQRIFPQFQNFSVIIPDVCRIIVKAGDCSAEFVVFSSAMNYLEKALESL